jgi:hypothetical protein
MPAFSEGAGPQAARSSLSAQRRSAWEETHVDPLCAARGSTLPHLGTSGVRFSKDIERLSGGRFEVKFFEPGAPRVDSFTEHLNYCTRAWMELAGCLILALPYVALVAYFSIDLSTALSLWVSAPTVRSA